MEIPKTRAETGEPEGDVFSAVALNQTKTDREILNDVYNGIETKEMQSAIKIGDVWLSIPSRLIAIYANAGGISRWWSYEDLFAQDLKQPPDRKTLQKLGIGSKMSRDPLEKFVSFSVGADNNVSVSEAPGQPSAVVVERNKPGDKVFTLVFNCTPYSIQNNIRPLFAQFMLAPFLPVHCGDLQRIVTPASESPEVYLQH